MFQDEARFGRISDPRRCWAPEGIRPNVAAQIVREYTYVYAAVSPHDGVLDSLILPEVSTKAMSVFLTEISARHPEEFILMVLDGASWHRSETLIVPENIRMEAVEETLVEALVTLEGDAKLVQGISGFDWIINIPLNAP
jgi:hypothetical protein